MARRGAGALVPLAGLALVAAHAAALPLLVEVTAREPLRVELRAPLRAAGAGALAIEADLPDHLVQRAEIWIDGEPRGGAGSLGALAAAAPDGGPYSAGMHRIEWRLGYRGGAERRVGWTQLTGPYQDPADPPCSVRVLFGQALLDDGAAGPHTVAHLVRTLAARELAGFDRWPLGRFERVGDVRLRWTGPEDGASGGEGGAARDGHVRADIEVVLTRAALALTVRLAPRIEAGELRFAAHTEARVRVESRVVQWLVDLVRGDALVTRLARHEIAGALDDLLTVPPPLDLGGGRAIELSFCRDRPVEIVTGSHAAVWLAVRLDQAAAAAAARGLPGGPPLLDPALGIAAPAAAAVPAVPPAGAGPPVAIELDGNALNGLLHILWSTGFLEEALAREEIVERFNRDPLVTGLLLVRARGLSLPLPPTASPARRPGETFELAVASALHIDDGPLSTPAHLFGRVGVTVSGALEVALSIRELGLTCEPRPGLLDPCYPELAAELIERAPELHGELSRRFTRLLARLFIQRDLGPPGGEGRFRIDRSRVRPPPAGRHGPLRIELEGRVLP